MNASPWANDAPVAQPVDEEARLAICFDLAVNLAQTFAIQVLDELDTLGLVSNRNVCLTSAIAGAALASGTLKTALDIGDEELHRSIRNGLRIALFPEETQ